MNLRQNLDLRALNPADAAEIEQVAQGMRATLIEVDELDATERGAGGFGSTGGFAAPRVGG